MHSGDHILIGAAAKIPVNDSSPILSFSPLVLDTPGRLTNLELRITFPTAGNSPLPIILLAHGQGRSNWLNSLEGYAPLAEFWAAHGFAVIQPTHLSAGFLGLKAPAGQELFWQQRTDDMVLILDNLDTIESSVPGLSGRLDRSRVAVAGHSAGSLTVNLLLGARNTDPRDGSTWSKPEPRIKAGIILGGIGDSSELSDVGKNVLVPFLGTDFSAMTGPALVVYGDEDVSPHLTTRGADWHADAYRLAPGPKDLLELKGAKHGLGGLSGWDAAEGDDSAPERLGLVQRMTWAYLQSKLYAGNTAWEEACEAFEKLGGQGRVERKL
ncbi:alpha/beta-hydrolase [Thozetella sp. PMI_491]|nr:alpha/beta-hydrolase [Thozetella sp. PMI_491]